MKIKILAIALFIFFLLFAFGSISLCAQEKLIFKKNRYKVGFITGYGTQGANLESRVEDYDYEVHLYQLQCYYTLVKKKRGSIELLLQPQFNLTKLRPVDWLDVEMQGYEFGLNGGLLYRKYVFKGFISLYACLSTGPHFTSRTPLRQARGFLFSDNLFMGTSIKVYKKLYLDVRYGIRHISNAGLKAPNNGLNDIVFSEGLYFAF